jgi:hypothetical protein
VKWAMSLWGRDNLPFYQQGDCFAASLLAMTSNLFSPASTNRRSVRLSGNRINSFGERPDNLTADSTRPGERRATTAPGL